MLGTRTQSMASRLLGLTERLGPKLNGVASYLLSREGEIEISEGADAADGSLVFGSDEQGLHVELPANRAGAFAALKDFNGELMGHVFVSAQRQPGCDLALTQLVQDFARLLEARAEQEYVNEDTTSHLLSLFEQIRAIHDLADTLPLCESLEQAANLALGKLLVALDARQAYLCLQPGPGEDHMHVFGITDEDPKVRVELLPFEVAIPGPVELAFLEGRESYCLSSEARKGVLVDRSEQSLLCTPISFGEEDQREYLGCFLVLDRHDSSRPFGNPQAEIAQSVGVLVGLVVGTRRQAHAQNQIAHARQIQKTLLPAAPPQWPGLRLAGANHSANQVGGDYFDYLEAGWGSKLCLIADVSGHDMASGIAMAMGRSELRGAAQRLHSPGEMLTEVSNVMFEDLSRSDRFITIFCLSFEERSDAGIWRARWSNAGHNPAVVLRKDGGVEWLNDGGPMVGFMPGFAYADEELWLEPGDLVILYTDGVTEAPDRVGELLEEEGLVRILDGLRGCTANEVLEGILMAINKRTGGDSAHDDVTVLVAEVLPADSSGE